MTRIEHRRNVAPHVRPRAHIARLFLHPHELRARRVCRERAREGLAKRVELLEAHDGDVARAARAMTAARARIADARGPLFT